MTVIKSYMIQWEKERERLFIYMKRKNNKANVPKDYQLKNIGEKYLGIPWIILAAFLQL